MTVDKWDSADGQTHDESELIATDEQIAMVKQMVGAKEIRLPGSAMALILARLAASEKEREWRGLLLKAVGCGCILRAVKNCHGSTYWFDLFNMRGDVIVREIPKSADGIPARPSDDVVAKIKGALHV